MYTRHLGKNTKGGKKLTLDIIPSHYYQELFKAATQIFLHINLHKKIKTYQAEKKPHQAPGKYFNLEE